MYRYIFTLISSVALAAEQATVSKALSLEEELDAKYTTTVTSKKLFMQPLKGLDYEEQDQFMLGFSFYKVPWVEAPSATTARDGLGPLFNANTCISCHPNNAVGSVFTNKGSVSRAYVVRLSIPSEGTKEHNESLKYYGYVPEPTYGGQLSLNGVHGVPFEGKPVIEYEKIPVKYPDGEIVMLSKSKNTLKALNYGGMHPEVRISPRKAPALVGLGLLEQLSDAQILANEDIDDLDKDGISGKANRVYSPEFHDYRIGRYTWKASAPTLKHQIAAAAHHDMGLSNPLFPTENCTEIQEGCLNAPKGEDVIGSHGFDLPQKRLDAITFYLSSLKIPKSRITQKKGEALFHKIDCTKCHTPEFRLGNGYIIKPFSDLLLHDMGEGLSDDREEFDATAKEWRTAPLWGIGKYKLATSKAPELLHDGRAKSIEEAILWHGGEAQRSKTLFMALPQLDREAVLEYISEL